MRCPDVFSQRGRGYGHALSPLLLLHLTFTLGATKGTVQANSNRIKKRARLALAKKLGDAESISELTDT